MAMMPGKSQKPGKFKGEIDDDFKAPAGQSTYDLDPDLGQRPYRAHEAREMAEHVTKAREISKHPIKSVGVKNHFKKQLADASAGMTSFDDLKAKVGRDMQDQD